jgi:hypothetical protein
MQVMIDDRILPLRLTVSSFFLVASRDPFLLYWIDDGRDGGAGIVETGERFANPMLSACRETLQTCVCVICETARGVKKL